MKAIQMGKRKAEVEPDVEPIEEELPTPAVLRRAADTTPTWHNKEKVLLLSSRGITHRCPISALISLMFDAEVWCCCRKTELSITSVCRHRHLMLDLIQLLPHCKKDAKLDTKTDKGVINEVADMKVCKPLAVVLQRLQTDKHESSPLNNVVS